MISAISLLSSMNDESVWLSEPSLCVRSVAILFSAIKAKSVYDIIITHTCILKSGDANTGINGVICGLDCPIIATSMVNPAIINPKERNDALFFHRQSVNIRLHNDINSITSNPLANGM